MLILGLLLVGCLISLSHGTYCEYEIFYCAKFHRRLSADDILLDPKFDLEQECKLQGLLLSCLAHVDGTCYSGGTESPFSREVLMKNSALDQLCSNRSSLRKDYAASNSCGIHQDMRHCAIKLPRRDMKTEIYYPELQCWLSLINRGCIVRHLEDKCHDTSNLYKALTGFLVSDDVCAPFGVSEADLRGLLDKYGSGSHGRQPTQELKGKFSRKVYECFEGTCDAASRSSFRETSKDLKSESSADSESAVTFFPTTESSSESSDHLPVGDDVFYASLEISVSDSKPVIAESTVLSERVTEERGASE